MFPIYCLLHAVHAVGKTIGLVEGLCFLREAVPHYFMQEKCAEVVHLFTIFRVDA